MTDTSSLSHLIERLEKATGPSRAMDVLIFGSVVDLVEGKPWSAADLQYASENPELSCNAPRYTSSIDAAMTLVPEGWDHDRFERFWHGSFGADIYNVLITDGLPDPDMKQRGHGMHKVRAIALCIAALKAQLSTRTNEQDDARNLSGVSSE